MTHSKLLAYFPSVAFCKSPNSLVCLTHPQWLQCIYYYLCRHKMTSAKKKPKQFLRFGRKIIQLSSLFHPQPPSGGYAFVLCLRRKHFWLSLIQHALQSSCRFTVDTEFVLDKRRFTWVHLSAKVPCKIDLHLCQFTSSYVLLSHSFK